LGCHLQHSIPIGFYYAKWSEKLLFHLVNAFKPERSHSRTSSRSRTPSPKIAPASTRSAGDPSRSPNPPERHLKSPTIASSSAATGDTSIEEARRHYAEENLNDIRGKRAAIFVETKDGLLTKKDKTVFW
jgi:hypothetical protein